MKLLEFLILHCTATPEGRPISKETIIKWHTDPVEQGGRGWRVPGYSDMIDLEGKLINIVPYDDDQYVEPWEITNGVTGINNRARHIVYVGGTDKNGKAKDTRTIKQRQTMVDYINNMIALHPNIKIAGHNQFAVKACPSFNVPQWLRSMSVDSKNIYQAPIV